VADLRRRRALDAEIIEHAHAMSRCASATPFKTARRRRLDLKFTGPHNLLDRSGNLEDASLYFAEQVSYERSDLKKILDRKGFSA
jgi:hypothetical protein